MRGRALLSLALGVAGLGLWRAFASTSPVSPLDCDDVVAIEEADAVRLACPDDAALRGCEGVRPGRRYRVCEAAGSVIGPLLAARGRACVVAPPVMHVFLGRGAGVEAGTEMGWELGGCLLRVLCGALDVWLAAGSVENLPSLGRTP